MTYHLGLWWRHYKIKQGLSQGGVGLFYTYCRDLNFWVGELCHCTDTSDQTRHSDGCHKKYGRSEGERKKKQAVIWRRILSSRISNFCQQRSISSLWQNFWESLTMRKTSKSIWSFEQSVIIRFTLNWMMKSKQVKKECMKNSIAEIIPRMVKPPG